MPRRPMLLPLSALLCALVDWAAAQADGSAAAARRCVVSAFDADDAPVGCPINATDAEGLECANLEPRSLATQNYEAILRCLSTGPRVAGLRGTFILPRGIVMPPNSHLFGREEPGANASDPPDNASNASNASAAAMPRLTLAAATARTGFLVRTASGVTLGNLDLDLGGKLRPPACCSAVLSVEGDGAFLYDLELHGSAVAAGVYLHAPSAGNLLLRAHVHDVLHGVVFAHGLNASHRNTFGHGTVEDVACDAVSFAGYGRLVGSLVRSSGHECRLADGSVVPGAAAFCRGNVAGGDVLGNTMHGACGVVADFDSCANFNVSHNELLTPGSTVGGRGPHCRAPAAVVLLDSQDFHVEGNLIANERGVGDTSLGPPPDEDAHRIFGDTSLHAGPFSDLPGGSRPVLGLVVARRPRRGARPCRGHEVLANRFRAACGNESMTNPDAGVQGCVGVGYFASRGTGADLDSARRPIWRPSRFSAGDASGSDLGSRRCGRNWYASDSPMCPAGTPAPCNGDDHEHMELNYRNDPCAEYFSTVLEAPEDAMEPWAPGEVPPPSRGVLRVPWPEVPDALQALW